MVTTNASPTCETILKKIDFIGGTLVEHLRYDKGEFRGTITYFWVKKNAIEVRTKESDECQNLFKLGSAHVYSPSSTFLSKGNGIWHFGRSWLGDFIIAPKGIEIPTRIYQERR